MNQKLKLVIQNTPRKHFGQSEHHIIQDFAQRYTKNELSQSEKAEINKNIAKLEGNLKILEQKYKSNLREGFENKIKAYRLQAVVQRKLLKQAIQQSNKVNQAQVLKSKIERAERQKEIRQWGFNQVRQRNKQRFDFKRNQSKEEKRSLSVTLRQRSMEYSKNIQERHDKIIEEQKNIGKKKQYLDFLKKMTLKKSESQEKRIIFDTIITNANVLKRLKRDLQDLNPVRFQKTAYSSFLTL